jgi:hypothetical protein
MAATAMPMILSPILQRKRPNQVLAAMDPPPKHLVLVRVSRLPLAG